MPCYGGSCGAFVHTDYDRYGLDYCPTSNGCWIQDQSGEFIFVPCGVPPQCVCPSNGAFETVCCSSCKPCTLGYPPRHQFNYYCGDYGYGGYGKPFGKCCRGDDIDVSRPCCVKCPKPTPVDIGTTWH